jgi:hypothetical protein
MRVVAVPEVLDRVGRPGDRRGLGHPDLGAAGVVGVLLGLRQGRVVARRLEACTAAPGRHRRDDQVRELGQPRRRPALGQMALALLRRAVEGVVDELVLLVVGEVSGRSIRSPINSESQLLWTSCGEGQSDSTNNPDSVATRTAFRLGFVDPMYMYRSKPT